MMMHGMNIVYTLWTNQGTDITGNCPAQFKCNQLSDIDFAKKKERCRDGTRVLAIKWTSHKSMYHVFF